jgi:hypothetical protein
VEAFLFFNTRRQAVEAYNIMGDRRIGPSSWHFLTHTGCIKTMGPTEGTTQQFQVDDDRVIRSIYGFESIQISN